MDYLIIFFTQLKKGLLQAMNKIRTGSFSSKSQRPEIQKILIAEVIDGEIVVHERWIIVNHKGETLEAPIFHTKEQAIDWLDEYFPEQDYAPN